MPPASHVPKMDDASNMDHDDQFSIANIVFNIILANRAEEMERSQLEVGIEDGTKDEWEKFLNEETF